MQITSSDPKFPCKKAPSMSKAVMAQHAIMHKTKKMRIVASFATGAAMDVLLWHSPSTCLNPGSLEELRVPLITNTGLAKIKII